MTKKILTTKFNYSIPSAELKKTMLASAPAFSAIPGCCWKIWLLNEELNEAGGVYLFNSATELEQFLNSELFSAVANHPAFSNLQTHTSGVAEAASVITGGPLNSIDV